MSQFLLQTLNHQAFILAENCWVTFKLLYWQQLFY